MTFRSRCLFYDGALLTRSIILAVEQLPLYLHRSYALLRELDEQVTGKHVASVTWLDSQ